MALDVFDHHDRVVDHDADREHKAEQGQIVDGKAERGHGGEGADQRHRNRDDRNDRRPPALQEHQHDDDDEDHRLVDGLDQFADGLRDELGRVVADIVVEPSGKPALSLTMVSEMRLAVASALEPGRWVTSIATADFRSRKLLVV